MPPRPLEMKERKRAKKAQNFFFTSLRAARWPIGLFARPTFAVCEGLNRFVVTETRK